MMKSKPIMFWHAVAMLGVISVPVCGNATDNGTIGLYFDSGAQTCSAAIDSGAAATMYALALCSGVTAGGIRGAEFSIQGFPPEWFAVANAPTGIALGSPLDGVGTVLGFPSCETGTNGIVTLFEINLFATSRRTDHYLWTSARRPPTNPAQPWMILTKCDSTFTAVAARYGQAIINPAQGSDCGAVVEELPEDPPPIVPPTASRVNTGGPKPGLTREHPRSQNVPWSAVKALYY